MFFKVFLFTLLLLVSVIGSSDPGPVQSLQDIIKQQNALIENLLNGNNADVFINKHTFNCALLDKSGVHRIQIDKTSRAFDVLCDQNVNGESGWTVVYRRHNDGNISFYNRTAKEKRDGFGDFYGEFFLGFDKLYALTNSRKHEIIAVTIKSDTNELRTLQCGSFRILDNIDNFKVKAVNRCDTTVFYDILIDFNKSFFHEDGLKRIGGDWQAIKLLIRPVNIFINWTN